MSVAAMLWALLPHDDVGAAEQLTLVVLADHANPDGCNAFPKLATVAARRGLSVRQVQRHLDRLQTVGLIRPGDQRWTGHLRADQRPVVWDLALDVKPATAPPDTPEWTPDPVDERGDTVIHRDERGDISGPNGVTSDVIQNQVLEPTTGKNSRVGDSPPREAQPVDNPAGRIDPWHASGELHQAHRVGLGVPCPECHRAAVCAHGARRVDGCALCRRRVPA